jgi:replicative DNA helicase
MNLTNGKTEEIKKSPDQLREAIAFSFDTKIGLDFLEEEERLYNHLHNKDRVIPTSINVLNKFIEGGYHCKSLTLYMAECVDENTIIKIRYKKRGSSVLKEWIEKEVYIKDIKNLIQDNIVEVTSPDGWVPVTKYIEKGKKIAWNLEIDNNSILSSGKHLYETNNGWKFAKDLNNKIDLILTNNGYKNFTIFKTKHKINVVDITVNHNNHRYYTNGVSSHNTNLGKSLIMASAAVDCILCNKNVLYVSCEMSEDKISERIMSNMFDIATEDLKLLPRNKFHEKFEKIKNSVKQKLVIKEYPPRAINANHIRNLVKELIVRKKFRPDIIFIDYLGIMNPIYNNKSDNSYLEVKRISEEVRALAVELELPIVSAVQTNRCLDFNTSVVILKNKKEQTISIKDIKIGDFVKSQNHQFNKVKQVYDIEENECYEIILKSGKKIICSNKHLFPTENGMMSIKNGLKKGDSLFSETNK